MKKQEKNNHDSGEIIIYESTGGEIKIEVQMKDETVWLSQKQMAELFDTSRPNITMHIKNIFEEGELNENSVCKDFLHTASDGKKYVTNYYNLDLIISLGYRKYQVKTLSPVEVAYLESIKAIEKKVEKKIKDKN